jgi:hypothetical protein
MIQKQKLIKMLEEKEWVCSTDFHANFLPEFRSIIAHLRKHEGVGIIDEPCLGRCGKKHDSKGLKRWKLTEKHTRENCPSIKFYGVPCAGCRKIPDEGLFAKQ